MERPRGFWSAIIRGTDRREGITKLFRKKPTPEQILETRRIVGEVRKMFIYPLNRGYRYEVTDGYVTKYGLSTTVGGEILKDKTFIIFTADTLNYITASHHERMVLIRFRPLLGGRISMRMDDKLELGEILSIPEINRNTKKMIWVEDRRTVPCYDCGNSVAEWISISLLGTPTGLRLGYLNEKCKKVAQRKDTKVGKTLDMFNDINGFFLMTDVALRKVQYYIPARAPINLDYFRTNIYVEIAETHPPAEIDETDFEWIQIGEVILKKSKAKVRCTMTNIVPETGDFNDFDQPLKGLHRLALRRRDNEEYGLTPLLGIHVEVYKEGSIRLGDSVSINVRPSYLDDPENGVDD